MLPKDLILKNSYMYTKIYGINVLEDPFPWFLLSMLLGGRIMEKIARRTFELFLKYGITSPEAIVNAKWEKLVEILDAGGYTRYDFKTATKLIDISTAILKKGNFKKILIDSKNSTELLKNLRDLGKGVGNVTVGIFLRELIGKYNFKPMPDKRVLLSSKNIGIDPLEYSKRNGIDYGYVENFLSATGKNCLKNRCERCVANKYCDFYIHKK